MSGEDSNKEIPKNEEIINELTKDLAKECTVDESNSGIPHDFEKSDSENGETKNETFDDDFIDEVALKDIEGTLSKEELDKRQEEALELKKKGNDVFKANNYFESIQIYTDSLKLYPLACKEERAMVFCNRAAAKIKLERNESAIDDCTKAIELNDKYVRAYLRRGKLYEQTDKLDESLADYKKVLELDPGNHEALSASVRLPPLINEKNEKMKAEMLGKTLFFFIWLFLSVYFFREA